MVINANELSIVHPVLAEGISARETPMSFAGASSISTLSKKQSGPKPEMKLNLTIILFP